MSSDVHTPTSAAGVNASPDHNPEVLVGAAFAGGLVAALILKKLFVRD